MTTFDVTWNKTPPKSKVLAKKRSNKPIANDITKQDNKKVDKKVVVTKKGKIKQKLPLVIQEHGSADRTTETGQNRGQNEPQKFVKRKHKKDKHSGQGTSNQPHKTVKPKACALFSEKRYHKDVHISAKQGKAVHEKVFSAEKKFSDLEIHKYLVSNLNKINLVNLTKVQEKSIPVIVSGQNVLVKSQTGSGKTLAYAVPILDALLSINPRIQRNDGVQVIVIVPTRELALQTHEWFGKINTFQWIVVGHLCGGENRKTEKDRLRKGVHILIATPGRLLDHILHTAAIKLDKVRCLVLDEADRLLDMGFKKDIVKIVEELDQAKLNSTYNPLSMIKNQGKREKTENDATTSEIACPLRDLTSKKRQTILLSATLTKGISELAEFAMKDHIYIDAVDEASDDSIDQMSIPKSVQQKYILTYVKHRLFTLSAMLVAKAEQTKCKIFVFMATSQMVDFHYELFSKYLLKMPVNRGKLMSGDVVLLDGLEESDAEDEDVLDLEIFKLHGNMDQAQRKEVFTKFRDAKKGVLICTDVVSRGIDVPTADCIIQYNGPTSDDDYLHRVGRTGRAGKAGSAYIFLTHEEQDYVTRLQERKVFLQEHDPKDFLNHLCVLLDQADPEKAAVMLQKRYETALNEDKELHRKACLAYTSWSRFYNTYPTQLRSIFDFRKVHLGHYLSSFGIRETPGAVARMARGQVTKQEPQKLNRKLAIDPDKEPKAHGPKRKVKSYGLTTSEYSSGLEPARKKKKLNKTASDE